MKGRNYLDNPVARYLTERCHVLLDTKVSSADDVTIIWAPSKNRILPFIEPKWVPSPPRQGMWTGSVMFLSCVICHQLPFPLRGGTRRNLQHEGAKKNIGK